MLYCDSCAEKNKWPKNIFQSHGKCEICGNMDMCHEVPSRLLPSKNVEVKYTLDEGGLIRNFSGASELPEFQEACSWKDRFYKLFLRLSHNRFRDDNSLSTVKPWRVELAPDVWVVGVFIYAEGKLVGRFYAERDEFVYREDGIN